jgi:hypothetical protein
MEVSSPKKKLLFSEICDGNFARCAQLEFEKMQSLFARTNEKCSLVMRITLYPVTPKKGYPEKFKDMDYDIIPPVIRHKSDRFAVEVNEDGVIIGDGKTISDILQTELRFEEEDETGNTIPYIPSRKEVNDE